MMVLEGEVFGRCLNHGGRFFMNGISAFIIKVPERFLAPPPHHVKTEEVLAVNQEEDLTK